MACVAREMYVHVRCVYSVCKACGVLNCHVRMVCIVFISEVGGDFSRVYGWETRGWFMRLR